MYRGHPVPDCYYACILFLNKSCCFCIIGVLLGFSDLPTDSTVDLATAVRRSTVFYLSWHAFFV